MLQTEAQLVPLDFVAVSVLISVMVTLMTRLLLLLLSLLLLMMIMSMIMMMMMMMMMVWNSCDCDGWRYFQKILSLFGVVR